MKKVASFLIAICLTIFLSASYAIAQVSAPSNTTSSSKSSSKTIPGMKELKKIEQRNKAAEKREQAAEKRAQKRAEKAAKDREEAIAKEDKPKTTSTRSKSPRTSSKKSNSLANVSVEPANPRPSAGPVDLSGHKKIVNGREVTVVEMEPRKN